MPTAPRPYCKSPGCKLKAAKGSGYCNDHRPKSQLHDRRPSSTKRGYDRRWRKIRARFLSKYPLCKSCLDSGITEPATLVDHILPLAQGGTHAEDNLQSLCWACHNKKTGAERRLYNNNGESE